MNIYIYFEATLGLLKPSAHQCATIFLSLLTACFVFYPHRDDDVVLALGETGGGAQVTARHVEDLEVPRDQHQLALLYIIGADGNTKKQRTREKQTHTSKKQTHTQHTGRVEKKVKVGNGWSGWNALRYHIVVYRMCIPQ